MKNWKTTLTGVAVVCSGGFLIYIGQSVTGLSLITIGVGLISAADSKKSEE